MPPPVSAETSGAAPARSRDWGNLRLRFISAIVMVPIVLLLLLQGEVGSSILAIVTGVACVREWVRIVDRRHANSLILTAAVAMVAIIVLTATVSVMAGAMAVVAGATALAGLALAQGRRNAGEIGFGVIYIGVALLAMLWMRVDGWQPIAFLFVTVWAGDTGAYLAGKAFGGPKLWPSLSPRKTWSGAVGGLLLAALAGGLVAWLLKQPQPGWWAVAATVVGVIGQCGDLFESAVKRRHGVKDSGGLIPGHGGVLDRMDALIAAAPAFAVIMALWGPFSNG